MLDSAMNPPGVMASVREDATVARVASRQSGARSDGPQARPAKSASLPRVDAAVLQSRILIFESTPQPTIPQALTDAGFRKLTSVGSPKDALEAFESELPDLVILDGSTRAASGLELLKRLELHQSIECVPALFLVDAGDSAARRQALDLGATDFLTRPVDPIELSVRVTNTLSAAIARGRLEVQQQQIEESIRQRTQDLVRSRQEMVHCLARAAEFRDNDTGHHVIRVGKYAGIIGKRLGCSDSQVELLELAAQLHDIGKLAIPDAVLKKPGRLDPEQFAYIQKHCAIGKSIIQPLAQEEWSQLQSHSRLGSNLLHMRGSPLLMLAARIAQTHHERWDGAGYPLGLKGEDIPIEGRITAVADVYDALSSPRPYKPAFPREKCFEILLEGRGNHFDPTVLDAFFASSAEVIEVQLQFMDVE